MERSIEQKTGLLAILSIVAAIAAFFAIFSGSPILGLLLALTAIPLGIFGVFRAASPRVSGGILSILGIVLGGFGLLVAVLGVVGLIIF
jgi:uncharacterized membrane protein HdeD (DUF308 family)